MDARYFELVVWLMADVISVLSHDDALDYRKIYEC